MPASAAAAWAARRAAAMKSDFAASPSLCRTGWPRSSRTRRMIAWRSGAPEPGSSGWLAIFGSSGSSRLSVGASPIVSGRSEPASSGSVRSFLPPSARDSPPSIERIRPPLSASPLPSEPRAATAAAAAASAGVRLGSVRCSSRMFERHRQRQASMSSAGVILNGDLCGRRHVFTRARLPVNRGGRRSSAACRGWPRRSWCCARRSGASGLQAS